MVSVEKLAEQLSLDFPFPVILVTVFYPSRTVLRWSKQTTRILLNIIEFNDKTLESGNFNIDVYLKLRQKRRKEFIISELPAATSITDS